MPNDPHGSDPAGCSVRSHEHRDIYEFPGDKILNQDTDWKLVER